MKKERLYYYLLLGFTLLQITSLLLVLFWLPGQIENRPPQTVKIDGDLYLQTVELSTFTIYGFLLIFSLLFKLNYRLRIFLILINAYLTYVNVDLLIAYS